MADPVRRRRRREPEPEPQAGTWEITWTSDIDGDARENRVLVDATGRDEAILRAGCAVERRITTQGRPGAAVKLRDARLLTRRETAGRQAWLRVMEIHARHAPDNLPPEQCRLPGCVAAMRGILELPGPGSTRTSTGTLDFEVARELLAASGCDDREAREVLMQARRAGTAPFGFAGGLVTAAGLRFTIGQYPDTPERR